MTEKKCYSWNYGTYRASRHPLRDSIAVYPHQTLNEAAVEKIVDYTTQIAQRLAVKGLINIQFVVENGDVYIIEVNPRSSRTVPYMSKITCIPMVNIATKIALGATLAQLGYKGGLVQNQIFSCKGPCIFLFQATDGGAFPRS